MADVTEMDALEKVDFVRSTVTPLDLAEMFELEVHGDKIHSPWNEADRTPSCHLYEDGFFDYSTGKGGDVIDLYMKLTGASWGQALNRLATGAERMDADPDRVRRVPRELPDLTRQFLAVPLTKTAEVHGWWSRRIPPIEPGVLGYFEMHRALAFHKADLWIPHWHDGVVRGIKIRGAVGAKSAVPGSTFACGLYRIFHMNPHKTLIITEGESDCWALWEHAQLNLQADVFSLPAGAGLWKDAWLDGLEQYETIYTAFDNDRAGRQATEKVRSAIGWGRWRELKVPDLYNDVREAMAAGWEPKLP